MRDPAPNSPTPPDNGPIRVVLASGSPYRAELLRKILPEFDIKSPDIDETPLPNEPALALAQRLAMQKAQHIAARCPQSLVIGSDQVALINSRNPLILGKPQDFETAHKQLTLCSSQTVAFITAVALIDTRFGESRSFTDTFSIKFRELDDALITNYLHQEQPYDCAGAIKTEALGIALIERFIGDDPNTLIGLPLIKLIDALKCYGLSPLSNANSSFT